jgi:preprotein translocase subunit YajC
MLLYYLICRDENKHKDFRKNISVGDEAFITHLQSRNGFDGIVTKVDEEFVTIETKVRKHLIYPKTKNNV